MNRASRISAPARDTLREKRGAPPLGRSLYFLAALLLLLVGGAVDHSSGVPLAPPDAQNIRFTFVDAYIDPKGQPLAAYQFELKAEGSGVTLVGVEGGEHPAYADAPYYDPKANVQNRIVIAAFNAGDNLPRMRTRVARVMLRVEGNAPPVYSAKLDVAASSDAKPIHADIQVSEGAAQ